MIDLINLRGIKCDFDYSRDILYSWYKEVLPTDMDYEKLKGVNPEPGVPGGWGTVNINYYP